MSYESPAIIDKCNTSAVEHNRRDATFGSTVQYTSSIVINLQKLQTDLHAQYEHEKGSLNDLNQRLHSFVNRVQSLQSENAKYLLAIAELRRRHSGLNKYDVQAEEHYFSSRSSAVTLRNHVIDSEWDIALYYLQISIFKQLIGIEEQWDRKRASAFEDELRQSASVLVNIRSAYGELQQTVDNLHIQCDGLIKQYLSLTHDWCTLQKQRKKWEFSIESLKTYILFYQNLHSYSGRSESSVTIDTDDKQYWTLELSKVIKRIRHDFEVFYATIYREMTSYYETKIIEMETTVKQEFHDRSLEIEEFSMTYQKLQIDYEKIQKSSVYEREITMKLESTFSTLESEYQSLRTQNEERYDAQGVDIYSMQDMIMSVADNVDEMRRSKASLEAEIIVYRFLLDMAGSEKQMAIVAPPEPSGPPSMGNFSVKKQRKGSIGIKECAPNAAFISLVNYSKSKTIDLSKWVLTRNIESVPKFRYTIPDGVRLEPGSELRIYAKSSSGAVTAYQSSSYHRLVNNDLVSWGTGSIVETRLLNKNGNEEAFYSQTVAFRRTNV